MKCKDCPYFAITQDPIRTTGNLWDLGLAKCKKYNLVVDWANKSKLNALECVERSNNVYSDIPQ
jgi:hypothetical protein